MCDYTLCLNANCPIKKDCFRYGTTPLPLQSYAVFEHKDGNCEYYIPRHEAKMVYRPITEEMKKHPKYQLAKDLFDDTRVVGTKLDHKKDDPKMEHNET